MKYLTLLFAVLLSGCVSWQWGHSPEPHGIPMGTHTDYEWQIVTPEGNSMWPYLKGGEPVIVVKIPWKDVERGDIVLSWLIEGERYGPFHRVSQFKRGGDWIYTKGTGQDLDSHIVREDNYIGIYAYTVAEWEANQ